MVVEQWDEAWTVLDAYRGVNANMHTVEALLRRRTCPATRPARSRAADLDAGRPRLRARTTGGSPSTSTPAGRRCSTTTATSRRTRSGRTAPPSATGWSGPADARPAGRARRRRPRVAARRRRALFDAGVREGWAVDGARRVRLHGRLDRPPVVRERMHWVAAEASPPPPRCTRRPATRVRALRGLVGVRRGPPPRPRARLLAPRARPEQPPGRGTWPGSPTSTTPTRPPCCPASRSPPILACALADGAL